MKKRRLRSLSLFAAFAGLVLSSSLPLVNKITFHNADADEVINPISDYWFNSNDPGYDSKQNYSLTKVGNPSATGTNSSHGTVTFDGVDDGLVTNGTSTSNTNNIFYDYASSDLTIAFDFTVKSWRTVENDTWMFPMTFYNGGDPWSFAAKGHVGFLIDPDGHRLRYADTTGSSSVTDWWFPDICQLTLNTKVTIVVTIAKSGNTKIYVNGNSNPAYDRPSFNGYTASGSDWSGFTLGGFHNRNGNFGMGSGGHGFTNCTFQYLKIYDFAFTSAQATSWAEDKDVYKKTYSITYETNGGTINAGQVNQYTAGTQVYLPNNVTKSGYVFGGWYETSTFTGSPKTVITPSDTGNKNYYAKWTAASQGDGQLTPNYYYRFTDSGNPGYESAAKASLAKYGTVSISSGSAVFDGTGALYAANNSTQINFSNTLTNFTIGLDLTVTSTSSSWQFPFSFGFDDTSWLDLQIAPNTTKLMFSCSGAKQGSQSNVYWGHTVSETLSLNQKYRITISFKVGGDVCVYVNGSLALSASVSSSFTTSGHGFNFSIGGNYDPTYNVFQGGFKGKIANFDVYTFAATSKESVQDGVYSKIYYDTYTITLNKNSGTYTQGYTAPTSYRTRVGATLPTSSQITRSGYSFKGWYTTSTFSGSAVTSIGINDTGNKTYYAKWIDTSVSTDPVAKYSFTNSSNPGADDMGNYSLTATNATASNGELSVTGNGSLHGSGSGHNFMNDYSNFTLSFDMSCHDLGSSSWVIPFSFGNNGTQLGCFNFNPDNPHVLRFRLKDGSNNIAGSGDNMLWGSELTYIPEWTWVNITISVTAATTSAAGRINIYVDGINVFNKQLPKGFKMPNSHLSFGGHFDGSNVTNGANASFRRVRAFNFAATADQVNYYLNNGYDLPSANTIPITYSVGEHGYASGPRFALLNETIAITTTPSENYAVDKVLVNGVEKVATSTNTYTHKVTGATSVSITYIQNVFNLAATTFGEGSVSFTQGDKAVTKVNKGSSVVVTVTPNSGYRTIGFKVNNQAHELVDGKYTINNVNENIEVIASFEEVKPEHTVTLHRNGGSWVDPLSTDTIVFTEGIGCSLPGSVDISRTGYSFAGWWSDEECEVSEVASISDTVTTDVELYAKWTPNDYTIIYTNLNGATINDDDYATGYTYGVGATLPVDVTKDGYTFKGWYDNMDCTGDPITSISADEHENKIFYAKLDKNTYTITLNTNGGNYEPGYVAPTSYTYESETMLPTSNNITKTGYTFAGWYLDSEFSGDPVDAITSTDFGNKVYYARWTNNEYAITYMLNDGSFTEPQDTTYEYNHEFVLPTADVIGKKGYTFIGWYLDPDFESEVVTSIEEGEIGNKVFYARYSANIYSVTYLEEDDSPFSGVHGEDYIEQYVYDQNATLDTPTREGFEFEGYYLSKEFTPENAVYVLNKETYSEDIVIYVHWTLSSSFSISYYLGGGEWTNASYPTGYSYGDTKALPTSSGVFKAGYSFEGWYLTNSFEGDPIIGITATDAGNKVFYAKWVVTDYSITYYDGDEVIEPSEAIYQYRVGTNVLLPTVNKSGYSFEGWYLTNDYQGNKVNYLTADDYGNKVFYAKFELLPTSYTIIFDSNDGKGLTTKVDVNAGEDVNLAQYVFEKDFYQQNKWFNGTNNYALTTYQDIVPVGQTIILYASYEPLSYSINYVLNGGTMNSIAPSSYKYGEEVILPTKSNIYKDGFSFAGWYLNEELTGEVISKLFAGASSNYTLYAKWNESDNSDTYDVKLHVNGGKIVEGNIFYYEVGETTTLPTNLFKLGYEFAGWYADEEFTGDIVKAIDSSSRGDKDYYAKWILLSFTVSVEPNENGILSVSTNVANYGSQITITATPSYGYELLEVYVNGELLETDDDTYSFLLNGDSYVSAVFGKIAFVVNIDEEVEHGLVESEYDSVTFGEIIEITLSPDNGYVVDQVIINGEDVTYLAVDNIIRYRAETINEDEIDSSRKQLSITVTFIKESEKKNKDSAGGCSGDITSSIYLIIPAMVGIGMLIIFRKKEYYKKSNREKEEMK